MLTALLVTWTLWFAHPEDPVRPHLYPEYYDTMDEAGVAAIRHAYDHSQFYEYGGLILRTTNGKYRVSVPETDYRGASVFIDNDRNDYAGYSIVADYHTHPCNPYSHYIFVFSDSDVNSDTKRGITGYMGELCTGGVRRFVPAVTKEDRCWADDAPLGPYPHCGATGDLVGSIKITRKPVVLERPGPIGLARGWLK